MLSLNPRRQGGLCAQGDLVCSLQGVMEGAEGMRAPNMWEVAAPMPGIWARLRATLGHEDPMSSRGSTVGCFVLGSLWRAERAQLYTQGHRLPPC